jgi:hypothetical protein
LQTFLDTHEFPKESRRNHILSYGSIPELRRALDDQEISSEELVLTYIYMAATKGLQFEAIADINFDYALKEAVKCDDELKYGNLRGYLHGIPISVKDSCILEKTLTTNGLIRKSNNIREEDGLLVQTLKNNGAIPFVKSNNLGYNYLEIVLDNFFEGVKFSQEMSSKILNKYISNFLKKILYSFMKYQV